MDRLDLLLDAGLFEDALRYLNTDWVGNRDDYLFYLAYIQIHLGWTEEAYQTLTKFQMEYLDSDQAGTVSGFLADIFHNEGQLCDAVIEITKALKLDPECSLIQSKAEEIFSDFNDFIIGLTILYLLGQLNWLKKF